MSLVRQTAPTTNPAPIRMSQGRIEELSDNVDRRPAIEALVPEGYAEFLLISRAGCKLRSYVRLWQSIEN